MTKNSKSTDAKTSLSPSTLHRNELLISYVLRGGVLVSGLIIGFGMLLTFFKADEFHKLTSQSIPQLLSGAAGPEVYTPLPVAAFFEMLIHLDPVAVTTLGLLSLIILPVIRVAMTVVLFFSERDYTYFFITAFVLLVLLSGLIFGREL